jgi:hypothetical protein
MVVFFFHLMIPALAGTDAHRGLAVALRKARAAAADSSAVLIVREVQRDYYPTGMAHAIHRITANTGGVRRSSAKAPCLYI